MTACLRALSVLLLAAFSLITTACAAEPKTNVILIMADDFGYECVGANGSTSYKTPRLDRMAAEGTRFTHCYSQPLCTPTRVQLMTGQSNKRNYVRFGYLEPNQKTFAHLLKDQGYATCVVGKWQLDGGLDAPRHFGFDEYALWQLSRRPSRYANPGLEINGKELDYTNGEYGPDLVCDYAVDFIKRSADKPFFLYYPMILTHSPYQPTPDSAEWDPKLQDERSGQNVRHFADMVSHTDKLVGRILDQLAVSKIADRTLVIFLGDNGTGREVTSRVGEQVVPGGKGAMTETGMRVPLIAWGKNVPAGKVAEHLVDSTDFLPSILAAAGAPKPSDITLDGHDFLATIRDSSIAPRKTMFCWYAPNQGRVNEPREFARTIDYKLYGDGKFLRVEPDKFAETPVSKPVAEQQAVRAELQRVLDSYKDARPVDIENASQKTTDDNPRRARRRARRNGEAPSAE